MKFLKLTLCLGLFAVGTRFALSSPVPFVNQSLVPGAVAPGVPSFTLTVNGAGFVSGSTVNWNGTPLTTTFVSAGKLTAVVPAANVSAVGTANVTVVNPGGGGGSSNPVPFTIIGPISSLAFEAVPVAGTTSPAGIVTADFNRDGIADLAVIDQAPAPSCNYQFHGVGSIAIFLGNGNGTFTKHSTLCFVDMLGGTPGTLALASDFNRDGNIDLAAVSSDAEDQDFLNIYYGNGDGTFSAPVNAASSGGSGSAIAGLASGDFFGSGELNVAMSYVDTFGFSQVVLAPGGTSLLLNDPVNGAGPLSAGDFDGDGVLDLAEGRGAIGIGSSLVIFRTQEPDVPDVAFAHGASLVSGDFNGDGILDVASTNGNSISVLLGNGDGTFHDSGAQPTSAQTNISLITADLNGDGILDLAVTDSTDAVSIWLGNGDGTFQAPVITPAQGDGLVAADFNGDGRMDLGVTNSAAGTLTAFLQTACGDPSQNSPISGTYNVPPTVLPLVVAWTNPTVGCVLHYTTDGTHPTAGSPTYPAGGLPIFSTTTIRVVAAGAGFENSNAVGGTWTLNLPTCGNPSQNAPFSGTYNSPQVVTWTNPTAGCVLHYATGGSAPTVSSPIYPSGGLTISSTTTIRVIAAGTGFNNSAISGGTWTIN